jgi:ferredoxin
VVVGWGGGDVCLFVCLFVCLLRLLFVVVGEGVEKGGCVRVFSSVAVVMLEGQLPERDMAGKIRQAKTRQNVDCVLRTSRRSLRSPMACSRSACSSCSVRWGQGGGVDVFGMSVCLNVYSAHGRGLVCMVVPPTCE